MLSFTLTHWCVSHHLTMKLLTLTDMNKQDEVSFHRVDTLIDCNREPIVMDNTVVPPSSRLHLMPWGPF